jgi:membrane dipeptidase
MLIDAHLDLAYNAMAGYDPRLPLEEARETPAGRRAVARGETPIVSLPALREGGIGLVFGTLFVLPHNAPGDLDGETYASAEEAYRIATRQAEWYHSLRDDGLIRLLGGRSDLADHVAQQASDPESSPLGVVLLMEGADPIREPAELEMWLERGVRIVGPAWTATRYSGGTGMPGPLTLAGRDLMAELNRTGAALDTSHMAEESFWQALRIFTGSVIASHSNCRRLVPTDRHLSDDMIRAIVDRDGVVGIVLFNAFLDARWVPGDSRSAVRLETAVRHIEHVCEIARDIQHVGIGTDFDGGFGFEGIPAEMRSCADLRLLGQALQEAGWREDEAAAVLGGNWLRWLEEALPEW